jgi:hypothetical protein
MKSTACPALSPGRPIDWAMPARWPAAWNALAVYSPPWSVCMITPGDLAAADGDGHRQRTVSRRGVVMPRQREPQHSARGPHHHRGEVELPFTGRDFGSAPYHLWLIFWAGNWRQPGPPMRLRR